MYVHVPLPFLKRSREIARLDQGYFRGYAADRLKMKMPPHFSLAPASAGIGISFAWPARVC